MTTATVSHRFEVLKDSEGSGNSLDLTQRSSQYCRAFPEQHIGHIKHLGMSAEIGGFIHDRSNDKGHGNIAIEDEEVLEDAASNEGDGRPYRRAIPSWGELLFSLWHDTMMMERMPSEL